MAIDRATMLGIVQAADVANQLISTFFHNPSVLTEQDVKDATVRMRQRLANAEEALDAAIKRAEERAAGEET